MNVLKILALILTYILSEIIPVIYLKFLPEIYCLFPKIFLYREILFYIIYFFLILEESSRAANLRQGVQRASRPGRARLFRSAVHRPLLRSALAGSVEKGAETGAHWSAVHLSLSRQVLLLRAEQFARRVDQVGFLKEILF